MASYAQSSETLKAILAHPSLQRDSIESTMDALADAKADADDIDGLIRDGAALASGESYDDAEIGAELDDLLHEVQRSSIHEAPAAPQSHPEQQKGRWEPPISQEKIAISDF